MTHESHRCGSPTAGPAAALEAPAALGVARQLHATRPSWFCLTFPRSAPAKQTRARLPKPRRKRLSQAAGDGALARLGKRVCNHRPGKRSAVFEPCPAGRVLTSCRDEQAPNIPTCSPRAGWEQTGPRHHMGTTELPWMPPSSSSHCIQTLQGQDKQRQAGAYVIHAGTKGWHQEWHHLGTG